MYPSLNNRTSTLLFMCLIQLPIYSQSSAVITGVEYGIPNGITAAPLQVLTLTLRGVKLPTARVAAQTLPLPRSLEGFSVSLRQTYLGLQGIDVPILAVEPVRNACSILSAAVRCGSYTALTVQVPGELVPNIPIALGIPPNVADFIVSVDGTESEPIRLNPVPDAVHILNACDLVISGPRGSCNPLIAHADGRPVTAQNPVISGEVVTMYAVGLGTTNPPVQTGAAAAQPISMGPLGLVRIEIEQRPPTNSEPLVDVRESTAIYAGLVQGYVGLYQINFRIPPIPPSTPSCDAARFSNLLVRYKLSSESSVGICARP